MSKFFQSIEDLKDRMIVNELTTNNDYADVSILPSQDNPDLVLDENGVEFPCNLEIVFDIMYISSTDSDKVVYLQDMSEEDCPSYLQHVIDSVNNEMLANAELSTSKIGSITQFINGSKYIDNCIFYKSPSPIFDDDSQDETSEDNEELKYLLDHLYTNLLGVRINCNNVEKFIWKLNKLCSIYDNMLPYTVSIRDDHCFEEYQKSRKFRIE